MADVLPFTPRRICQQCRLAYVFGPGAHCRRCLSNLEQVPTIWLQSSVSTLILELEHAQTLCTRDSNTHRRIGAALKVARRVYDQLETNR